MTNNLQIYSSSETPYKDYNANSVEKNVYMQYTASSFAGGKAKSQTKSGSKAMVKIKSQTKGKVKEKSKKYKSK
jgi:hypothetical protein